MRFWVLSLLLLLTACGGVQGRIDNAQDLQQKLGYTSRVYQTSNFPLYSAAPLSMPRGQDIITIVIEGDGYAWVSRSRVSGDPTPKNPVGLHIATRLPMPAFYLARACQYVRTERCHPRYWSVDRFATDVMHSYDQALDQIKAEYGAPGAQFHLIGFSGSAYAALDMAATRADIAQVTTIAGLISPADWTDYHGITPLAGVPDTALLLAQSSATQFTHICSTADKVLPCALTAQIIARYGTPYNNHVIKRITGARHGEVWKEAVGLVPTIIGSADRSALTPWRTGD